MDLADKDFSATRVENPNSHPNAGVDFVAYERYRLSHGDLGDGGVRAGIVPVPARLCVPVLLALVPHPATTITHPLLRLRCGAAPSRIHQGRPVLRVPAALRRTHQPKGDV
jgi:hypothetical protein